MSSIYAPPTSPPPPHLRSQSSSNTSSQPHRPIEDDETQIMDPPPAYSPYPNNNNQSNMEQTLDIGPSRMDFSGPPPVPHRIEVEREMNRRNDGMLGSGYVGDGITIQSTGGGGRSGTEFLPPPPPPAHPSLPPRQPTSTTYSSPITRPRPPPPPPPPPPPVHFTSTSSSTPNDTVMTPTETPTPGRPLLNKGKFLIYPIGFVCKKCNNTGYKHDDPYHPCKTCWSKYGKTYTSVIAHSWPTTTKTRLNPNTTTTTNTNNDTTSTASNYQRPLRSFPSPQSNAHSWTSTGFGNHLSPPPRPPPPPPPPPPHPLYPPSIPPLQTGPGFNSSMIPPIGYSSPQDRVPFITPYHGYGPPPGSVVVMPGDPRIGGVQCFRCRGTGMIETFFGLDQETCQYCRGVGRVF